MSSNNIYYVYMLIDPRNNLPFYIGKGKGNRAETHYKISKTDKSIKANFIKKFDSLNLKHSIEFYILDVTEETAFLAEKALIAKYGRIDNGTGILSNMSDGGAGGDLASGRKTMFNPVLNIYKRFFQNMIEEKLNEGWILKGTPREGRKGFIISYDPLTDKEFQGYYIPEGYIRGRNKNVRNATSKHNIGKPCSDKTRQKLKEVGLGKEKPGTRDALMKLKWMNKNGVCKRVHLNEIEINLNDGWSLGRPFKWSTSKGK